MIRIEIEIGAELVALEFVIVLKKVDERLGLVFFEIEDYFREVTGR